MKAFPTPAISVNVDVTNPGQFFACCGLLELADRLWPGAEGWFQDEKFHLNCEGSLTPLLRWLSEVTAESVTTLDNTSIQIKPLIAPLRFHIGSPFAHSITVDYWAKIRLERGIPVVVANQPWNFWSGHQTPLRIWKSLQSSLAIQLNEISSEACTNLFRHRVFQKGRFGFDPGPSWNTLDVGFSPNEQCMPVYSSPAVELLSVIGMQRFRPNTQKKNSDFEYYTWSKPLCPIVAAIALTGNLELPKAKRFLGCIISRGQYAALGYSQSLPEEDLNDRHLDV